MRRVTGWRDTRRAAGRTAVLLVLVLLGGMVIGRAAGATPTNTRVIYSFGGDNEGEYPSTDLIRDHAGNLYGTSVLGGTFGSGTVFELSPTQSSWVHTVLYSFTGEADGGQPYGGVALDHGNLYGSAVVGGMGGSCVDGGCGVVYELKHGPGGWSETVIHDFTGDDGYGPGGGLTVGPDGSLFGMTPTGGPHQLGVIFQLKPLRGGGWKFIIVHAFAGGRDGATGSSGRLLLDGSGGFYGLATVGGAHDAGTAFHATPRAGGGWTLVTLYAFKGEPDAGFPYGGLVADRSGDLFGTTYYAGANDLGAVYELVPGPHAVWSERLLYSFKGGSDGSSPIGTLVRTSAGDLYGTTSEGGAAGCGCGTIFKVAESQDRRWTETVAYRFTGPPDAAFAYNGMVADPMGNFYGATVHGGTGDDGAIYRFTPQNQV